MTGAVTAVAASPLRIVAIAPLRFPIRIPFAGGLESAVWNEVRLLRSRGHRVELVATAGSDFLDGPGAFVLPPVDWRDDPRATDDTYPEGYLDRALPALDGALSLIRQRSDSYDVILNHCLNGLPLARAGDLGVPMISTLHTPVVPDLVASHDRATGRASQFLSVSRHTARVWAGEGILSEVLHNGVDATTWVGGPGGPGLVWFGRIVPEKAPHLAIEAASLLDLPLDIAGRIGDRAYFEAEVAPRLDARRRYVGPLATGDLVRLVGRSACALVTPLWDEPFGLVSPEALFCGTPVAAFGVGGVAELAEEAVGLTTAAVGDVADLAARAAGLVERARQDPLFRASIRTDALGRFSLSSRIDRLEDLLMAAARGEESAA